MASKDINLFGTPMKAFVDRKLPTINEVMRVFFYHHSVLGLKVKESVSKTATMVQNHWKNVQILTSGLTNTLHKINDTFKKWQNLQRNHKRRKSIAQKQRETVFMRKCEQLFNIVKKNILKNLSEEKKSLLTNAMSSHRQRLLNFELQSLSEEYEEMMELDVEGMYSMKINIGILVCNLKKKRTSEKRSIFNN